MRIGLGLPNATVSLGDGGMLIEVARRAEELGFASLATIGRVAYPSYEELVVLAAAAGATRRIGLLTDVLLGPTREPVLLAKQAASLDQLSGGRFVLGVGVGGREDDFAVTGMGFKDRGRRWDRSLDLMHRAWRGEPLEGTDRPVTPRPVNGESVPMSFGGRADQMLPRLVKYGIGYTQGGGTPEGLAEMKGRVDEAWRQGGRQGQPEYRALAYFALGEDAQAGAEHNVRDYYGPYGDRVWAGAAKDAAQVRERIQAYEAVGCDELVFFMTAPGVAQTERLAEAATIR
jgi:alkanesulfonate monooxygenase SsuD/methylene tetrahydromethanopterin reductase-like flavin-dependent oxidoreductase (luciferase family)